MLPWLEINLCHAPHLLRDDAQHFDGDAIELVQAGPSSRTAKVLLLAVGNATRLTTPL